MTKTLYVFRVGQRITVNNLLQSADEHSRLKWHSLSKQNLKSLKNIECFRLIGESLQRDNFP